MLPRLSFVHQLALIATNFKECHSAIAELRQNLKPLLMAPQSNSAELRAAAQDLDTLFAKLDHFFKEKNNKSLEALDDFLLEKLAPAKNYDLLLLQQPLQGVVANPKPIFILDSKALYYYDHSEVFFFEITRDKKVIAKLHKQLIAKNEVLPHPAKPRSLSFNEQKIISALTDYVFVDFKAKLIKLLVPEFTIDGQSPALLKEALQLTQIVAECLFKMHAPFKDLIKTAGYEEEVDETLLELSEEFKKKNILYQKAELVRNTPLMPATAATGKNTVDLSPVIEENIAAEEIEAKVEVEQEPLLSQAPSSDLHFQEAFQLKTAWQNRTLELQNLSQGLDNSIQQLQMELTKLFSEQDKNNDEDQHILLTTKSSKMAGYLIQKNEITESLQRGQAEYQQKLTAVHQKIMANQLDSFNAVQAELETTKQILLTLSQSFLLGNSVPKPLDKMQTLVKTSKEQVAELDKKTENIKTKIQHLKTTILTLENTRAQTNQDLPSFDPLKAQVAALQTRLTLLTQNTSHFKTTLLKTAENNLQAREKRQQQAAQIRRIKVNAYISRFTNYLNERATTFKIRDFFSRIAAFFLSRFRYKTEKNERMHYIQGKLIPRLQQYAHSGSKQDKTKLLTELSKGIEKFSPRSSSSQKSLRFFLSKTRNDLMIKNNKPEKTSGLRSTSVKQS